MRTGSGCSASSNHEENGRRKNSNFQFSPSNEGPSLVSPQFHRTIARQNSFSPSFLFRGEGEGGNIKPVTIDIALLRAIINKNEVIRMQRVQFLVVTYESMMKSGDRRRRKGTNVEN